MKRLFDILVSLAVLVVASPVILLTAILIKATSRGAVLHRSERVGRGGRLFTLYKFRTMRVAAGPRVTSAGDPRITPVGRVLRRSKLDELPQLYNVLKGDMSLVGPRPEDPHYVAMYSDEQRRVLDVRPGLTSVASIKYRNEEALLVGPDREKIYVDTIMPDKLSAELEYLKVQSFWSDLRVLMSTVRAVLR